MGTLLKNIFYLDAEMASAKKGDILVEGGEIVSVGTVPQNDGELHEIIDGKGRTLVIPGFVNGHTHAAMVLLRGLGEELPLSGWLEKKIWPVEAVLRPEHIYWGTRGAIIEMASTGTTCFTDMYFDMDQVGEAAEKSGINCCMSRGIVGADLSKLEEGIALFQRWNRRKNIIVQLGPHAPYTVPLATMKEISRSAVSIGAGVHFHFLEAEWEAGYLKDTYGLSPFSYLEQTGLLGTSSSILAHCVWCPAEDIPKLKGTPVTVAHNPASNMKLGSGFAPLEGFLSGGVSVSLGTDGAASNNRLDMWGEMRLCSLIHKGIMKDPTVVSARSVFGMATVQGARAAGFEKVGLIREGWKADLAIVDLDKPQYEGWNQQNLIGFIVYAGSSRDVTGTMAGGRWIYRDGRYPEGEYQEVRRELSRCRKDLMASAGLIS